MSQNSLPGLDVEARVTIDQTHAEERALFEQMRSPDIPWTQDYLSLLDEGWYWRDAAYIAWKSLPKKLRQPQTYEQFCDIIGISCRTMTSRRQRNKAIDLRAAKGVVFGALERVDEVVEALVDSATNPGYKHHPDRKLYLEMVGAYTPKQALSVQDNRDGDLDDLDEDDLRRMAGPSLPAGEGDDDAD